MFNDLVESVAVRKATNEGWGFVVSLTFQSACLLALILIPLIYTQALPGAMTSTFLVAPSAPAAAPPSPPPAIANDTVERTPRLLRHGVMIAPPTFPPHASRSTEPPLLPEDDARIGVVGGDGGGDLLRLLGEDTTSRPPMMPAQPVAPARDRAQPERIVLGGVLEEAKLTARIQPVYPALAIQAHVQGAVVLPPSLTSRAM